MGMSIGSLNPNGFPAPAPQPGMGIMAMMASAVPQPAALAGGVLPLPGPASATPTLLAPPLAGNNNSNGEADPLLKEKCRKSSSPSVSLINIVASSSNPGVSGGGRKLSNASGSAMASMQPQALHHGKTSINSCESESLMMQVPPVASVTSACSPVSQWPQH